MAENLKQKAATGMVWTSIQKFAGMGIRFVSGIILARLLLPEDYGCIGMLAIFMVIANAFIDGGFASALIQKKRPTQEDYSTIFFWNLGMSLFMYFLLFVSAPMIARFYKMPILSSVLRVQGIVVIIHAFAIIQANQLRKQLRFKKLAIIHLSTAVISLIITIIMAYNGFGVWALVSMNLLTALIPAIIFWVTNKWYPLLVFSKKSFKELFGFGVFMFLTHIINSICNNIQGLLIGRLYNPATMGYYSKAVSTEGLVSTSISSVMGQVTYPLYAEFQDDNSKMITVIRRITCSIAYITFPMMFLLILLAKPLFILLYSDRWLASVPYFQILCIAGIAICLQGVNYQAIAAVGKSKEMFSWTLIKRIIGLALVIGGLVLWGLKGLLVGMVLQSWVIYLINAYQVHKYIGYKLQIQLLNLLPIFLLSFVAFASSFIIKYGMPDCNLYLVALIRLIVFTGIYLGGSILFKMDSYKYVMDSIPLIFSKFGRKSNKNQK